MGRSSPMDRDGLAMSNPSRFRLLLDPGVALCAVRRCILARKGAVTPHLIGGIGTALRERSVAEIPGLTEIGTSEWHTRHTVHYVDSVHRHFAYTGAADIRCRTGGLSVTVQSDQCEVRSAWPVCRPVADVSGHALARARHRALVAHVVSSPYAIAAVLQRSCAQAGTGLVVGPSHAQEKWSRLTACDSVRAASPEAMLAASSRTGDRYRRLTDHGARAVPAVPTADLCARGTYGVVKVLGCYGATAPYKT